MYTWGLLFWLFFFFKLFNTFWILTQMDSEKALANTIFYLFVTWQHAIVSWQVFCNFFTRMHQRWVATHLEETNLKQNPVHFGVSIIPLRGWWCFLKLLFLTMFQESLWVLKSNPVFFFFVKGIVPRRESWLPGIRQAAFQPPAANVP